MKPDLKDSKYLTVENGESSHKNSQPKSGKEQ